MDLQALSTIKLEQINYFHLKALSGSIRRVRTFARGGSTCSERG